MKSLQKDGRGKHYKRGGGAQVLRGILKSFLKSVRDCFGEPKVAVNALETRFMWPLSI